MATATLVFDLRDRISRKLLKPLQGIERISTAVDKLDKQINLLNNKKIELLMTVKNKATKPLNQIKADMKQLNGKVATPTVRLNDQASSGIDSIYVGLNRLSNLMNNVSSGAVDIGSQFMSTGWNALISDAGIAAVTGQNQQVLTQQIQYIYYEQKAGATREDVGQSLKNINQQTGAVGNEQLNGALVVSKINSLNPNLYERDISAAVSAFYNAQGVSFERIGDSLAYIFRNGGDQNGDLMRTFNQYAATFAKLEISPEQLASGFIAGQKAGGFNYDVLANAVRSWGMKSFNEMNDEVIDAYVKVLGKERTDALYKGLKSGDITGGDMLAEVMAGFSKLDPMVQQKYGAHLFGNNYKDHNEPILQMAQGMSTPANTTGELDKQFNVISTSPIVAVTNALRDMELIIENIGTSILVGIGPAFNRLSEWMKSVEGQDAISKFSQSIVELGIAFGEKLAGAIQWTLENWEDIFPVLKQAAVILGTLFAYSKISKFFTLLMSFARTIWSILVPVLRILIRVLIFVFNALRPFWGWLARIGIRFIPYVGWAIMLGEIIYFVVRGIIDNFDTLKEFFGNAFELFKKYWLDLALITNPFLFIMKQIIDKVLEFIELNGGFGAVFDKIKEKIEPLKDVLVALIGKLVEFFRMTGSEKMDFLNSGVTTFTTNVVTGLVEQLPPEKQELLKKLMGWLPGHKNGISDVPFDNYPALLHQGETVLPKNEAEIIRTMAGQSVSSQSAGAAGIVVQITGDNHYSNDMDAERVAKIAVKAIGRQMKEGRMISAKGAYA